MLEKSSLESFHAPGDSIVHDGLRISIGVTPLHDDARGTEIEYHGWVTAGAGLVGL